MENSIWFERVSNCDKLCVIEERLSWIKCQGLLVAAWTEENLKLLAALWGDFVIMHSDSKENRVLDVARFLVATRHSMIRDERVSIFVDGREFIVHCEEESAVWNDWDKTNHHLLGLSVKSMHVHIEFPILDIPGGGKLVGNVEGGATPFEAVGRSSDNSSWSQIKVGEANGQVGITRVKTLVGVRAVMDRLLVDLNSQMPRGIDEYNL